MVAPSRDPHAAICAHFSDNICHVSRVPDHTSSFFHELRIPVGSLLVYVGEILIFVKAHRFAQQMPFAKYGRLVICLVEQLSQVWTTVFRMPGIL